MRKALAVLAVISLFAALAVASSSAATQRVSWHVGTNKTVRIRHGQKVTWVWTGDSTHNVKGKGFKSRAFSTRGKTYTHLFRSKGKFTITCTFHPGLMKTVVKVS